MMFTGLRILSWTALLATLACAAPLPVILKDGTAHVAALALEREAGIVLKRLPGREEYIACSAEQCAPMKGVLAEGDALLVPLAGLSEALGLTANYDASREYVSLVPVKRDAARPDGLARVGAIAPNLRLTQLDGKPLSLEELRGQRVLINSWASW